MAFLSVLCAWLIALVSFSNALSGRLGERKAVWEYKSQIAQPQGLSNDIVDPATLYPAYNLSVPVDHFHNESQYEPHSNRYFPMRYWFDASNYKPGGPVIILLGGETSGSDRLPFLQNGILAQLAQATNGIGVVLEHRYYGESYPTPDLSTKNLRFLTTQQALADTAYFARNIEFPGLEHLGNLTSATTPYITYGGSYAGAFSAFLRVLYPDVFWGSISSSGVTEAIWDYWAYFEPIATYAPVACSSFQKTLNDIMDNILIGKKDANLTNTLKTAFGLQNVTYDDDFANIFTNAIYNWQSLNWDPAQSSPEFYNYCNNITSPHVLYPDTRPLTDTVKYLITQGGHNPTLPQVNSFLNLIGYTNLTQVAPCAGLDESQNDCFSTRSQTYFTSDENYQSVWRSWTYQYCTQWGFLQTGNVPKNTKGLISRTLTLDYEMLICGYAFNITSPPDVQSVNKYGGYNISYPRLAIIDGEWDPWRPATPHAFGYGAQQRTSTTDQPFILIPQAVHHWDENGLFPNQTTASLPPPSIVNTQKSEAEFVTEWLKEYKAQQKSVPVIG